LAETTTVGQLREHRGEFTVIDVRESDELSAGKIDGSVHMPLGALIRNARQGKLEDLKGKKIVTHCSTGYRGNIAADELNKAGFQASSLQGGFNAWKENK
jgi:rhodanese-related sulfurtransferase